MDHLEPVWTDDDDRRNKLWGGGAANDDNDNDNDDNDNDDDAAATPATIQRFNQKWRGTIHISYRRQRLNKQASSEVKQLLNFKYANSKKPCLDVNVASSCSKIKIYLFTFGYEYFGCGCGSNE